MGWFSSVSWLLLLCPGRIQCQLCQCGGVLGTTITHHLRAPAGAGSAAGPAVHNLRAPLIYGGVAVSLGLVSSPWCFTQGAWETWTARKWPSWEAISASWHGIRVRLAFTYTALQINATDTCRTRERFYAPQGSHWMNCQLAGNWQSSCHLCLSSGWWCGSCMVLPLRIPRTEAVQGQPGTAEKSQWCTRIR